MKRKTFQVTEPLGAQCRLGPFLVERLLLDEGEVKALLSNGAVYLRGRRCQDYGAKLHLEDTVTAVLEESGRDAREPGRPSPWALCILYEDSDLLAVDKPAGLTAQPTPSRVGESLVDLASAHLGAGKAGGRPAGLVHRLDRETSGVTVFGKNPKSTAALAAAFRSGAAQKRYLAATGPGLPPEGTVELPLSKDPSRPGRVRATRAGNGVPARTDFFRLSEMEGFCLVALFPRTGKTHQLRAHLTALGSPILGDRLYGGAREALGLSVPRCLLHAEGLLLPHPRSGVAILIEAPVPPDLRRFFSAASVVPPSGEWLVGYPFG